MFKAGTSRIICKISLFPDKTATINAVFPSSSGLFISIFGDSIIILINSISTYSSEIAIIRGVYLGVVILGDTLIISNEGFSMSLFRKNLKFVL